MFPRLKLNYPNDLLFTNPIGSRKLFLCGLIGAMKSPYLHYVGITKHRMSIRRMGRVLPAFPHTILGVFGWSPEKQVRRIHATRVVASVTNHHAVRNNPEVVLIREPMHCHQSSVNLDSTVAQFIAITYPIPAVRRFLNTFPESFKRRYRRRARRRFQVDRMTFYEALRFSVGSKGGNSLAAPAVTEVRGNGRLMLHRKLTSFVATPSDATNIAGAQYCPNYSRVA
jgi:hypothetical protein